MIESICFLCGDKHPWKECPSMEARAPAPPFPVELPHQLEPSASLPTTQFEQLFGRGAEGVLLDVLDGDKDTWSEQEQDLALRVLAGLTTIDAANNEDRSVLDEIARKIALPDQPGQKPRAILSARARPSYVRTQEEMEHFPEEYQPAPEARDWPISPDHPEGKQD